MTSSRLLVAQLFLPWLPLEDAEVGSTRTVPYAIDASLVTPGIDLSGNVTPSGRTTPYEKEKPRSLSIVDDLTMRSATSSGRTSPMSHTLKHHRSGYFTALSPSDGSEFDEPKSSALPARRASGESNRSEDTNKTIGMPRVKSSSAVNRLPPILPSRVTAVTPAHEQPGVAVQHHRERVAASNRLGSVRPGRSTIVEEPTKMTPVSTSTSLPRPLASLSRIHRRRSSSASRLRAEDSSSYMVRFRLDPSPHTNGGLVNAIHAGRHQLPYREVCWIGTPGVDVDEWNRTMRREVDRRYFAEKNCLPVYVPDGVMDAGYSGYCKQILWNTMHYSLNDLAISRDFAHSGETERLWWTSYEAMNVAIAERLMDAYRPGDLIWVNGYHLMLVPALLRQRFPDAAIGYFLHVAFPSSELFRCLAQRTELLSGMLGSDLIGMQTWQHTRHLRITMARILGLETGPSGIQQSNRVVAVDHMPIGIDVRSLKLKAQSEDVLERYRLLKENFAGYKLIVGRDKLDHVKGVRQKLLGFERFLELFPEWAGKVVLIQIATVTANATEIQTKLGNVLTRINSRWATLTYSPIVFLHQDIPHEQYLALLKVADAFLATSLREGMNLTSHEYVCMQEDSERLMKVASSEFTGTYTANTFRSAIIINPFDALEVARSIHQALTMTPQEASDRWKALNHDVSRQTAQTWVTTLLRRVEKAALEAHWPSAQFSNPQTIVSMSAAAFRSAENRLLMLDLEGGLVEPVSDHQSSSSAVEMPEHIVDLLHRLTAAATIYLVSSYGRARLDPLLSRLPGVGCVAENGCDIRLAGHAVWHDQTGDLDLGWRQPVHDMLAYASPSREDRGTTIAWHFCSPVVSTDSDDYKWSRRKAADAQNHIIDSLGEKMSLRIVSGDRSCLMMPRRISRGTAASFILASHDSAIFDHIFAISADDRLVRFLRRLSREMRVALTVEIVGIGQGARSQSYTVASSLEAVQTLQGLVEL